MSLAVFYSTMANSEEALKDYGVFIIAERVDVDASVST